VISGACSEIFRDLGVAIVAAGMATQTPRITVADGVQKINVKVMKHSYSVELSLSNGMFTMSVDKSDCIKSKEPGNILITEKYEDANARMLRTAMDLRIAVDDGRMGRSPWKLGAYISPRPNCVAWLAPQTHHEF
jgi:hypothetical protein